MFIDNNDILTYYKPYKPPSSRGLGHLPFTEVTGIRIPLGVLCDLFFMIFKFNIFILTVSCRLSYLLLEEIHDKSPK